MNHPIAERLAEIFRTLKETRIYQLERELEERSLTVKQYYLLTLLQNPETDGITMHEIAEAMEHTTAATTSLVDRIEKLGYAQRQPSKVDRRSIIVTLTESGAALIGQFRQRDIANIEQFMGMMDERDREIWVKSNERIFAIKMQKPANYPTLELQLVKPDEEKKLSRRPVTPRKRTARF